MATAHLPRRVVLILCCYCMSTGSILVVGPATCLSAMAVDLGMVHEAQMGLFLGTPFWGLAAMTLFSGWLAERLGYRLLLLACAFLQAAGLLTISLAEGVAQAAAGSLLLGLGRGGVAAPLTALLCAIYPEDRTRVTNIFHAFFHIGMVAIILFVLLLFHLDWDWRAIFQAFAALVLPIGIAALFVALPGGSRKEVEEGRMTLRSVSRQAGFGLLLMSMFFTGATELGPSSWLPYFIERAVGSSQVLGAVGLLLLSATMAAGRLAAPAIVRRMGVKFIFIASSSVSAASILLAALPVGTVFTVFWLTVLGVAISVNYPTLLAYAADRFPRANASMFAILNGAAIGGCIAGPASIGLAAEVFGLRPAMGLLAIAPIALLIGLWRLVQNTGAAAGQAVSYGS